MLSRRIGRLCANTVGYDRWETDQELAILASIHDDLRLYINFFQPSLKTDCQKNALANQTIKRYDTAKTPYQACSSNVRIFL